MRAGGAIGVAPERTKLRPRRVREKTMGFDPTAYILELDATLRSHGPAGVGASQMINMFCHGLAKGEVHLAYLSVLATLNAEASRAAFGDRAADMAEEAGRDDFMRSRLAWPAHAEHVAGKRPAEAQPEVAQRAKVLPAADLKRTRNRFLQALDDIIDTLRPEYMAQGIRTDFMLARAEIPKTLPAWRQERVGQGQRDAGYSTMARAMMNPLVYACFGNTFVQLIEATVAPFVGPDPNFVAEAQRGATNANYVHNSGIVHPKGRLSSTIRAFRRVRYDMGLIALDEERDLALGMINAAVVLTAISGSLFSSMNQDSRDFVENKVNEGLSQLPEDQIAKTATAFTENEFFKRVRDVVDKELNDAETLEVLGILSKQAEAHVDRTVVGLLSEMYIDMPAEQARQHFDAVMKNAAELAAQAGVKVDEFPTLAAAAKGAIAPATSSDWAALALSNAEQAKILAEDALAAAKAAADPAAAAVAAAAAKAAAPPPSQVALSTATEMSGVVTTALRTLNVKQRATFMSAYAISSARLAGGLYKKGNIFLRGYLPHNADIDAVASTMQSYETSLISSFLSKKGWAGLSVEQTFERTTKMIGHFITGLGNYFQAIGLVDRIPNIRKNMMTVLGALLLGFLTKAAVEFTFNDANPLWAMFSWEFTRGALLYGWGFLTYGGITIGVGALLGFGTVAYFLPSVANITMGEAITLAVNALLLTLSIVVYAPLKAVALISRLADYFRSLFGLVPRGKADLLLSVVQVTLQTIAAGFLIFNYCPAGFTLLMGHYTELGVALTQLLAYDALGQTATSWISAYATPLVIGGGAAVLAGAVYARTRVVTSFGLIWTLSFLLANPNAINAFANMTIFYHDIIPKLKAAGITPKMLASVYTNPAAMKSLFQMGEITQKVADNAAALGSESAMLQDMMTWGMQAMQEGLPWESLQGLVWNPFI